METNAADGLLSLIDAVEESGKTLAGSKRAHRPRRPYRCGRCGLPKSGHLCAFRKEQRSVDIQTDHTCLATPCNSLTLLPEPSPASSDDASDDASSADALVRCITDETHASDEEPARVGTDSPESGSGSPPTQRARLVS